MNHLSQVETGAIRRGPDVLTPAVAPLPAKLLDYRGLHAGSTMVVCGSGASLQDLVSPERFITIGTDEVRLLTPDYRVVGTPGRQVQPDVLRHVQASRARAIFTTVDLDITHTRVVRISAGQGGEVDGWFPAGMPARALSAYVSLNLAIYLGATRIGLIGVDGMPHNAFGEIPHGVTDAELARIDCEYRRLRERWDRQGVEIVNLSTASPLTAFTKMSPMDFSRSPVLSADPDRMLRNRKVFFVNYTFLACGDVFRTGLTQAARELGIEHEVTEWNDPALDSKVAAFSPDLLFVVHGRRFSRRRGRRFQCIRSAVWLLDEPYEVDDTSRFSKLFHTVFVNDPGTIDRHQAACYLPVCYDPGAQWSLAGRPRTQKVGFIGGYNQARESLLKRLARRGQLSYVVGGPWRDAEVNRRLLAGNVPPARTSELYRDTLIVLNVFRTIHHYNRERIPATSLNPRVYEATACGALVVSEWRPELAALCPEMPAFRDEDECVTIIEELLADPARYDELRRACAQRLSRETYVHRLAAAMRVSLEIGTAAPSGLYSLLPRRTEAVAPATAGDRLAEEALDAVASEATAPLPGWAVVRGGVVSDGMDELTISAADVECGIATLETRTAVTLSFEVRLDRGCRFIAKLHHETFGDPAANSYHLLATPERAYVARHHTVLGVVSIQRGVWQRVEMTWDLGVLTVSIAGRRACRAVDSVLAAGHCFIGVTKGSAAVRKLTLVTPPVETRSTDAAGAPRPRPILEPMPFSAMPRRNLMYHVWPVRGSMWRWNVEQLLSRIDLFNGRRIVGIVHDARSEDPDEVHRMLDGHGCEFVIRPNGRSGEVLTFPSMLAQVRSLDRNEVTFYGHAKGVKYEPSVPEPVRRWATTLYRVALDDWPAVQAHLERFAMTGPLRIFGRFRPHRYTGNWHYCGTFFWLRHAFAFTRDVSGVRTFYGGVEAWPGMYFKPEETGCLFMDGIRRPPYDEHFWSTDGNSALAQWEAAHRLAIPPANLVKPEPFEGHATPRLEQHPEEFGWFLDQLVEASPSTLLVIGSMQAGVEWHVARWFRSLGRDIQITTVDIKARPELLATIADIQRSFQQPVEVVVGDSLAAATRSKLASRYDAVFIDGDHGYRAARADADFALSRSPRLIALHDIVDSAWHAQARCCVSRVWSELRATYSTEERIVGDWGGIGLVRP